MINNTLVFEKSVFDEEVSNYIFNTIKEKLSENGTLNIALSGGNTPLPILSKLAEFSLNWNKINFFIVDERCVPITHSESNTGNIKQVFFNKIDANFYSPVKEDMSLVDSAMYYEKLLKELLPKSIDHIPIFDLILLGMGEDGHTASLFPGTDGLNETRKLVLINKIPKLNTDRITFSYPLILNANEIFIIVAGEKKIKIIKEISDNNTEASYPIKKIIDKHKNVKWLIHK